MVQPASIINSTGQKLDVLVDDDGTVRLKKGVGSRAVAGLTPEAAWQGVASHTDGEEFLAGDGVVALGGVDRTGTDTVRPMLVDPDGHVIARLKPATGALTNRSGTITVGGTQQTLAAALVDRAYLFVQNVGSEDLWINFTTAAVQDQPSIRLGPGDTFTMEGAYVSPELVSIIGATTGQKFTAKEA